MGQTLVTLASIKDYLNQAAAWIDEKIMQKVITFFSSLNVWVQSGILILAALLILLGLILFS